MARFAQLVVDCANPSVLARFWTQTLEEFDIRPYHDEEIARLAALGFTPETDPTVMVDGPHFEICFQRVDVDSDSTKRRLHLDIKSSDLQTEVARLAILGASIVEEFDGHTWLQDPEGNDFCVFGP